MLCYTRVIILFHKIFYIYYLFAKYNDIKSFGYGTPTSGLLYYLIIVLFLFEIYSS